MSEEDTRELERGDVGAVQSRARMRIRSRGGRGVGRGGEGEDEAVEEGG